MSDHGVQDQKNEHPGIRVHPHGEKLGLDGKHPALEAHVLNSDPKGEQAVRCAPYHHLVVDEQAGRADCMPSGAPEALVGAAPVRR